LAESPLRQQENGQESGHSSQSCASRGKLSLQFGFNQRTLSCRPLYWRTVARGALMWSIVGCCALASAQPAAISSRVQRVFVGEIRGFSEAGAIRQALMEDLRKHGKPALAAGPESADATLTGSGELWVKGYYSLNPRERSVGADAHRIYGGYLSVELRDRKGEVVWSYLVTPRRSYDSVNRELAAQVVKKLREAISP